MPYSLIRTLPDVLPRLQALAARAVAPLLRASRYHGIWGPGVHLMRDLSLRAKVQVVGTLVGLLMLLVVADLVSMRWSAWQRMDAAVHATREVSAVSELQARALDLVREADDAESDGRRGLRAPAVAAEREAHDLYQAVVVRGGAGLDPPLSQATVERRRAELLGPLEASPSPATDGLPGPRLVAARRYAEAIEPLRYDIATRWAALLDGDPAQRAFKAGLVNSSIELRMRLSRIVALAVEPKAGDALAQRRSLNDACVEVQTVMALGRADYERARALIPERSAELDAERLRIESALELVSRAAAEPVDTSGPRRIGGAELRRAVSEAQAGAQRMASLGLQWMEARLIARRDALRGSILAETALMTLGAFVIGYLVVCSYKVIAGGLTFLCAQVDRLGGGDLTIRPMGQGRDEVGRALTSLGQAASELSSLLESVTHGVAAVSHASRVVASGNAGLAGKTDTIRTAIAGVSASTQGFALSMDRCSDAVERAADNLQGMRVEGQRGRRSMEDLHARMRSLQTRSREIIRVVDLIEGIAYQTRLLAINASVEAARAGAAGRGFSVVAQEVRALAARSAEAAHRINDIVDASVAQIDAGNEVSERLLESLSRSEQQAGAVNAAMAEIVVLVRAGQAESLSVLDVARHVDDTVADNTRLVRQLSEASADLRDEGDTLKRSVQHFEFGRAVAGEASVS